MHTMLYDVPAFQEVSIVRITDEYRKLPSELEVIEKVIEFLR